MATRSGTEPAPGAPGTAKTSADEAKLQHFDRMSELPLLISAILPLIIIPGTESILQITVGVVTWLVFVWDLRFHVRHQNRFLHTWYGSFDLAVVLLTAPWYLLPGAHGGSWVVLLRLARLLRVLIASNKSRQLMERLGRVALFAFGVMFTASAVAYFAEHPVNKEFATFGDALWWGIVTLTTVGYGDIVPKTSTGRWAAVTIMLTGIAVLGLLAGSLASFLGLSAPNVPTQAAVEAGGAPGAAVELGAGGAVAALSAEVAMLRHHIEQFAGRVEDLLDRSGTQLPSQADGSSS
jgi:voltage-gated potassium channel